MATHRQLSVLRQLLAHLNANPDASDAAEGIARWWFGPTEWVSVHEVVEALDVLIDRKVVSAHVAADGRRRYRLVGGPAALRGFAEELQGSGHGDE